MTIILNRRSVLATGLGAIASAIMARPGSASIGITTRLPLPVLIEPDATGRVALRLAAGRHAFAPGASVASAGINGAYLGPLVRLQTGSEVTLEVENRLGEATTLHWHGLFVPSSADGGPHNIIGAGETWAPHVRIDQPPALTWFHPHLHGEVGRQTHSGLAGLLVVADGRDRDRGLPDSYGVDDLALVLQDRRVIDGENAYAPDAMDFIHGFRGGYLAVNGAIGPVATVPAAIVRLRLLNGANARNFHLRFSDGRPMHVVVSDGGFLARPVAVERLTIAPGERYEALVDFSDGRQVELMTGDDDNGKFGSAMMDRMKAMMSAMTGGETKVMSFAPDGAIKGGVAALPSGFDDPGKPDLGRAVRRRSFVFDERNQANMQAMMGAGMDGTMPSGGAMDHSAHGGRSVEQAGPAVSARSAGIAMAIAGEPFDMARVDVEAQLGSEEIWELSTQEMAHPFHIHGASLRVLTKNGKPPADHETGWKDVALVEGKAEILVRFDRPASRDKPFMFHCHVLEHEDAGMMGQFVTV